MPENQYQRVAGRPTRFNALRNRLYYLLKPSIPQSIRIRLRSWLTIRKRKKVGSVWPILPGSERKPEGWPGWPDGKKFAFVLTHDVEGQEGLDNCRQLMQLEIELGFRSSYNFIPEGTYQTPIDLRKELTDKGFEVGIHDLRHDGLLYNSPRQFARNADRINHHLKNWGAVGFRSGFMLNRLDWLHALNIHYDASTFDTDPFEPQPEGRRTIFPFWVPACGTQGPGCTPKRSDPASQNEASRNGYLELPYTLPQDSTLFLLLREKTPQIWMRKLDWIAEHGGMALVNIHPDYIEFGEKGCSRDRYPAIFIREFLTYISAKYAGMYWNPLAKDLARWFSAICERTSILASGAVERLPEQNLPVPESHPLKGKKAAVLLYSYYPSDPRPRRAAEALVSAGMEVDLFCLRQKESEPNNERIDGVNIFRMPMPRVRGSAADYIWRYGRFILSSFWFLISGGRRGKYDLVHVHNMPDALVFAALLPKLGGARIILDLHDPMPELMMSINGLKPGHILVRMLRTLERWSIRFADLALTPNITFRNLFVSRSCKPEKMRIVMNSPRQDIFDPGFSNAESAPISTAGEFRIMHHGEIVSRHGLDILVEAVARVRAEIPGIRLDIYGSETPFLETVCELARRLGIKDIVHYHGPKPQTEIAKAIRNSHLGVIPNRALPFTEINFPTRIFEFLAMHRPVIAPATQGIRDYFSPDQLPMYRPGDVEDMAARILWAKTHPEELSALVARGVDVYRSHLWSGEKAVLLKSVAELLNPRSSGNRPLRIAMVTHSFFESDNRVMRYAKTLAARGDHVDVFALRRTPELPEHEVIDGVNLYRIKDRFDKSEKSKLGYLWPLIRFLVKASRWLTRHHKQQPYDILHIHNVPDFIVFSAWYPKLKGARIILDVHDIVPEFFASKFGTPPKGAFFTLLTWMERASAAFVDHVIIANHLWLDKYAARTRTTGRCTVFINNVDSLVFKPRPRTRQDGKLIVVFPGGLHWHQGVDLAIRAFKQVSTELPNAEFHIYGDGDQRESLKALVEELGLGGTVKFVKTLSIREIAAVMADADLGVVPKRADGFGNEAYSTKIMEFMSVGVPVVISSTKVDRFYFDDSVVRFFPSGDIDALAREMVALLRDPELRRQMAARALEYADQNCWERRQGDYLALVDSIFAAGKGSEVRAVQKASA